MESHAIITGDIINSRKISPKNRERLYEEINRFLQTLKKKKIIKRHETYRGDSIQCETNSVKLSLRTALMIRSYVKSLETKTTEKIDIRLSLGIGSVDFLKNSLALSDGEAFLFSGEGLEELKGSDTQLSLKTNNREFNNRFDLVIILLDVIVTKYSPGQAEVILYKLLDMKEEEIAQKLEISQSAVNQRAKSSSWYAIDATVKKFETYFS